MMFLMISLSSQSLHPFQHPLVRVLFLSRWPSSHDLSFSKSSQKKKWRDVHKSPPDFFLSRATKNKSLWVDKISAVFSSPGENLWSWWWRPLLASLWRCWTGAIKPRRPPSWHDVIWYETQPGHRGSIYGGSPGVKCVGNSAFDVCLYLLFYRISWKFIGTCLWNLFFGLGIL